MTRARRRTVTTHVAAVLGVLVTLLGAVLVAAVASAPAAEAASYRYWTYWWGLPGQSSWTFAQLGPASDRPKDQSVVGWRFAVTTESGSKKSPRVSAVWADHCSTPVETGRNRVAVVVDYGTTDDAPPGETPPGGGTARVECVTIPAGAGSGSSGVAALGAAQVTVRFGSNGLVCGLDGYPRTECAAIVADPTPTPTRSATAKPSATPKPSASRTATSRPTTAAAAPSSTRASATTSGSTLPATSAAASDAATATPTPPPSSPPVTSSGGPGTESALPVSSGAPVGAASDDGNGVAGPLAGVALVVVVGAGAWWTARRRTS